MRALPPRRVNTLLIKMEDQTKYGPLCRIYHKDKPNETCQRERCALKPYILLVTRTSHAGIPITMQIEA